jgi:hypothetical protein
VFNFHHSHLLYYYPDFIKTILRFFSYHIACACNGARKIAWPLSLRFGARPLMPGVRQEML